MRAPIPSLLCGTLMVLTLAVTTADASNIGYRYKLGLVSDGPTAGLYWVAIPYMYTPPDSYVNALVDAEDLVQDLQPTDLPRPCTEPNCAVMRVWRWDETTGVYESWTGGAATGEPFEIEAGASYALELQTVSGDTAHTINLAGAHDPSFEFDDCHTPDGINMRWISIPPHLDVDDSFGTPEVLDAEDLARAMGGPDKVFQIRRWNESTGLYENWVVGSSYGTPFEIELSRAYAVDLSCVDLSAPCGDCPWTWTPTHH
ncbi:MAG: hypothetical protein DRJ61_01065 [Acidobacteria bacterium]|nr:MAG: hypothetical protein DRJ61_01065 [Acidobacteriota bacterium]